MIKYAVRHIKTDMFITSRKDLVALENALVFESEQEAGRYIKTYLMASYEVAPVNVEQTITLIKRSLMYNQSFVTQYSNGTITLSQKQEDAIMASTLPTTPWEMYLSD